MRNMLIALTVLTLLLSMWFVNPSLAQTPTPTVMTPAPMMTSAAMPAAPGDMCVSEYTVKAGDQLYRIAATEYSITTTSSLTTPRRSLVVAVTGIISATNAKAASDKTFTTIANQSVIRAGWKLCIPRLEPAAAVSAMMSSAALPPVAITPAAMMPTGASAECTSEYTVKPGDQLFRIAATEYNITVTKFNITETEGITETEYSSLVAAVTGIISATNAKAASDKTYTTIANESMIRAGSKLCIPKFEPAVAETAVMTPVALPPVAITPAAMPTVDVTPAAMSTPMAQPSPTP
jgi:LysM repeat protein